MNNLYIHFYYSYNSTHCLKSFQKVKDFYYREIRYDPIPHFFLPDIGDDPSFIAKALYKNDGGALTFGVCQKKLRKRIKPDDIIAFFALSKQNSLINYYFIGFAVVKEKISPYQIWENPDYKIFRHYANQLLRHKKTNPSCYYHYEWSKSNITKCNKKKSWHQDWYYRCDDYIIFKDEVILNEPIKVACYNGNNSGIECWCLADQLVKDIYIMTVGYSNPRRSRIWIKSRKSMYSHPYIRKEVDKNWISNFKNILFNKNKQVKAYWL